MTSERQKAANQANARHSTGPKTPEGKATVRLNAVRHGLLTRDVVLPEEDAAAFEDLFNQVRANFSPVGPIEEFLVDVRDQRYVEAPALGTSGDCPVPFADPSAQGGPPRKTGPLLREDLDRRIKMPTRHHRQGGPYGSERGAYAC